MTQQDLISYNLTIKEIANLFNILGDYTRCRIVACLFDKPMIVGDIAKNLNMSISAISHSLRILKTAKIVKNEKHGKTITYTLEDKHIFEIFLKAKEHIQEWKK